MGANSSQEFILDEFEQELIYEFWPKINREHKDLFAASWLTAIEASPRIRVVFGFAVDDEILDTEKFNKTVQAIKGLFDSLILKHEFESQKCRKECEVLGARHVNYAARGFKPFYWDIFTACLVYSFEEEVDQKASPPENSELVKAWRKLVQKVVEMMRDGYRNKMHENFVAEKLKERQEKLQESQES